MINVNLPKITNKEYNVLDYKAVEGGIVSNTLAFNSAIIDCHKNGGGKVIIPRGMWLTGPIELLSNVNLVVSDGAIVFFDKNEEEYPLYHGSWEGLDRIRAKSPISAFNQENIAITGCGILDAQGDLWRGVKRWKLTEKEWDERIQKSPYVLSKNDVEDIWYPTETAYQGALKGESDDLNEAKKYYDLYRPSFVLLYKCNTVLLDGVTFQNSPAWNIHPLFTNDLTISNCNIRNPYYAQNGDGMDIESCHNVHIHHNFLEVGDDGICVKAGKNKKARLIEVPCTNVNIHDCTVYHAHGGFVVGSEMSRGVHNVYVHDCNFIGTDVGIRFKSCLGRGGVVSDININNIRMTNIKDEAIILTMGYMLTTLGVPGVEKNNAVDEEDIPYFKDITIENVICLDSKRTIKIDGLENKNILNIKFKDVTLKGKLGVDVSNAKNIIFENVSINEEIINKTIEEI